MGSTHELKSITAQKYLKRKIICLRFSTQGDEPEWEQTECKWSLLFLKCNFTKEGSLEMKGCSPPESPEVGISLVEDLIGSFDWFSDLK